MKHEFCVFELTESNQVKLGSSNLGVLKDVLKSLRFRMYISTQSILTKAQDVVKFG